jgi:hypothetical protein
MKNSCLITILALAALLLSMSNAFAPIPALAAKRSMASQQQPLYGFLGDKERDGLTRDSEPEDFFQT